MIGLCAKVNSSAEAVLLPSPSVKPAGWQDNDAHSKLFVPPQEDLQYNSELHIGVFRHQVALHFPIDMAMARRKDVLLADHMLTECRPLNIPGVSWNSVRAIPVSHTANTGKSMK